MGGDSAKKGGKGAPKLKRSGRAKHKYASQFARTARNKRRRILKHNGPEALAAWERSYASTMAAKPRSSPFA